MSARRALLATFLCACVGDKPATEGRSDTAGSTGPGPEDTAEDGPPCADQVAVFEEVVAFMTEELEANGVPGGNIAIVCDGRVAFSAGVGLLEAGGTDPVLPTTRFQVASVTKMFTAGAAAALADQEVVDMDAPVSEILPEINTTAPYTYPATLHHLLSHTAGYPTQFPDAVWTSYELEAYFQNNRDQPLWSPPGAVFNYSNLGMSLAGLALQTASGTPFAELVETEVFRPAGMDRATMSVDTVLSDEDYARGHSGNPSAPTVIGPEESYYHTGYYGPMGGAWASAEDLARWAEVHMEDGGDVMQPETLARLRTSHTPTGRLPGQTFGYSLFMDSIYGEQVLSHSGSVGGYLTDWRLVPETGIGVAVTINADWYWPGTISDHALDLFAARGAPDLSRFTWNSDDWDDLVGVYEDPNVLGTIIVSRTSTGLQAEFVDRGFVSPLSPTFDLSFFYEDVVRGISLQMVFWREEETGPASWLVTLLGVGTRTED